MGRENTLQGGRDIILEKHHFVLPTSFWRIGIFFNWKVVENFTLRQSRRFFFDVSEKKLGGRTGEELDTRVSGYNPSCSLARRNSVRSGQEAICLFLSHPTLLLCLTFSLSLSYILSLSFSLPFSLFSLSLSYYLSLSHSHFLTISFCLTTFLFPPHCLSLSFFLSPCFSLSLLSLSIYLLSTVLTTLFTLSFSFSFCPFSRLSLYFVSVS